MWILKRNENKITDEADEIYQANYLTQAETMCAKKQVESNLVYLP